MPVTDDDLRALTDDLYRRLGGLPSKDARLISALLVRWEKAERERDAIVGLCISPEYGTGGHRIVAGYREHGDPQLYAVRTRDEAVAAIRRAAGLDSGEKPDGR